MNTPTVIYHSADYDGIFCREIAKHFIPDANLIGWDYGDPTPDVPLDAPLYMLDISVDGLMKHPNLIWIDHHKSAIEKYPATIEGLRIDGVAACRLAWQWFSRPIIEDCQSPRFATKDDFVNRVVHEPIAVRLAGEYDIWDKRDPDAEVFQFGLRSRELSSDDWNELLRAPEQGDVLLLELLRDGKLLQTYQQLNDASVMRAKSFLAKWNDLTFLCLNTARCNSLTFAALDVPETAHDALMGLVWNGSKWTVSLYHAKHRTDLDLSKIAAKYGGGGHRGACGFQTEQWPLSLT